jgi:hypothetical protein
METILRVKFFANSLGSEPLRLWLKGLSAMDRKGRGFKNHQPKSKWVCAENSSAKNTHSKLKKWQHADTATNAALACFSFYKRLTSTSE